MYDLLAALNAALIPLSAIFLWQFTAYQCRSHGEDNTPLSQFGWSLFFISFGMFSSAILYFLHDYDVIYRSTQIKLSAIPRFFFLSGLIVGLHALGVRWSQTACIVSSCLGLGVLITRIIF